MTKGFHLEATRRKVPRKVGGTNPKRQTNPKCLN